MSIAAIANLGWSAVQDLLGRNGQTSASMQQNFQTVLADAARDVSSAASKEPAGAAREFLNELASELQNGARNPSLLRNLASEAGLNLPKA